MERSHFVARLGIRAKAATASVHVLIAAARGILGQWVARGGDVQTIVEQVAVKQGDAIDFITDCVATVEADSFTWPVELTLVPEGGRCDDSSLGRRFSWSGRNNRTGTSRADLAVGLPAQSHARGVGSDLPLLH